MLRLNDLPDTDLNRIRIASAYLFSPEQARNDEFLRSLKFDLIRQAFRERAKQYHPDGYTHESPEILEKRRERFIKIRESYETLANYIGRQSPSPVFKALRQRTIIAVGGAKGGIGKSVFSANLGVLFSRLGYRTVLVDLDLGGANLHLYLGETSLARSINDFLAQRVFKLEDIMIATKYGPALIGGDSSQLGAANLHYSLKLKLLRSIKTLDADTIILDLGSGTSFNTIDFFLAADHRLVLTTCDPSSYLTAYSFIVVSLLRTLNRVCHGDSNPEVVRHAELKRLIEEATLSRNGRRVKTIPQLLERIRTEQPQYLLMIHHLIERFRPYLVVNMVDSSSDATPVVERIRQVAQKMLSVDITYLGALPYQPEIRQSTRDLIPVVAKSPAGPLSRTLATFAHILVSNNPVKH